MPPQERADENTSSRQHEPFNADRLHEIEPLDRTSALRRESFIVEFTKSKGPPQIVVLITLLGLGFGSTIGVVPSVMTDRYARLNHGYKLELDCAEYAMGVKPQECLDGSADAQNAVALEQMVSNTLTFLTSSLVGSLSDEYGRKGAIMRDASVCLQIVSYFAFRWPRYIAHWCHDFLLIASLPRRGPAPS